MKRLLSIALFAFPFSAPAQEKMIDIPVSKLGTEFRLLGALHEPLGKMVVIQGKAVSGTRKAQEGPQIRVLRIDGRATQDDIVVDPTCRAYDDDKSGITYGKYYELKGYETGRFVGSPQATYKVGELVVATRSFGFETNFIHRELQ